QHGHPNRPRRPVGDERRYEGLGVPHRRRAAATDGERDAALLAAVTLVRGYLRNPSSWRRVAALFGSIASAFSRLAIAPAVSCFATGAFASATYVRADCGNSVRFRFKNWIASSTRAGTSGCAVAMSPASVKS